MTDAEARSAEVGFLGLGTMGKAMAGRLLATGSRVTVWNRSSGHSAELVGAGATVAPDVRDAFAPGTAISMLANDAAVLEVFSPEVLATIPAGSLHIGMSTISPDAAE